MTTRLGRSTRFWSAVVIIALIIPAGLGVYLVGFSNGRADQSLDFARRAECRATLAVPVNDAKDQQQAAFGVGMIAGLLGDDPAIRAALLEAGYDTPEAALRDNATAILAQSARIKREVAKRGDPVKACKDGDPDN